MIKERPGEPRFGLDNEASPTIQVWNDLSWPVVQPAAPGASIVLASAPATLTVSDPGASDEKHPQYLNDKAVTWESRLDEVRRRSRTSSTKRPCWWVCTPAEMLRK
ncbi:MAG: hypothetical protein IPN47_22400 [Gemmatimonadetes bacterium]|nr:hypothetical protein [Gemmatimonadota bacterium]